MGPEHPLQVLVPISPQILGDSSLDICPWLILCLRWQSLVTATETVWLAKPRILTVRPFSKNLQALIFYHIQRTEDTAQNGNDVLSICLHLDIHWNSFLVSALKFFIVKIFKNWSPGNFFIYNKTSHLPTTPIAHFFFCSAPSIANFYTS